MFLHLEEFLAQTTVFTFITEQFWILLDVLPSLLRIMTFCQVLLLLWATSWENLFLPYANNKGADQPAHPRSLISTFVVRCLDSIIPLVSISEMSSLYLASVAVQAGLSLP